MIPVADQSSFARRKVSVMPIEFEIDHARRLVIARAKGVFTDADAFGYQRDAWCRPDVVGYSELVDMTEVEGISIPLPAGPRIQQLAVTAARQDPSALSSKFAIRRPRQPRLRSGPAVSDLSRDGSPEHERSRVFRTIAEALEFLRHRLARIPERPAPAVKSLCGAVLP